MLEFYDTPEGRARKAASSEALLEFYNTPEREARKAASSEALQKRCGGGSGKCRVCGNQTGKTKGRNVTVCDGCMQAPWVDYQRVKQRFCRGHDSFVTLDHFKGNNKCCKRCNKRSPERRKRS